MFDLGATGRADRGILERTCANGAGKQSPPIATQSKEPAEDRLGKAMAGTKRIGFCGLRLSESDGHPVKHLVRSVQRRGGTNPLGLPNEMRKEPKCSPGSGCSASNGCFSVPIFVPMLLQNRSLLGQIGSNPSIAVAHLSLSYILTYSNR